MAQLDRSPEGMTLSEVSRRMMVSNGNVTHIVDKLLASGDIKPNERVVLFNTGAGLKYTDMTAEAMHLKRPGTLPTSLPVGGIITPV